MLKRMLRKEVLARSLVSFMGLAMVAVLLLSMLSTYTLGWFRKKQYEENLEAKMQVALEDLKRQFTQAQDVALHISATYECNRRIFSQHKYYEIELVETLAEFDGKLGFRADYFVIYFNEPERLYITHTGFGCSSTYSELYFDQLGITDHDQLIQKLMSLEKMTVLRYEQDNENEKLMLACPFRSVGNSQDPAMIVWILDEQAIFERVLLTTGGIGSNFSVLRDGACLTPQDLSNCDLDELAESEKDGIRLIVDPRSDPLYEMNYDVERVNGILFVVIAVVLALLAVGLAFYNYKPIRRLTKKYKRMDDNEIVGIETLIDEAQEQLKFIGDRYAKGLKEQQAQVLLLLLNGICSERVLSNLCILRDQLKGPWYSVIAIVTEENAEYALEQMEILTDDAVSAYVCSWERNVFYVLLSMSEAETAEDMANLLKEFLDEHALTYQMGLSDPCQDVALLGGARRQASERTLINKDEEEQRVDEADGEDERMQRILEYVNRHAFEWELTMASTASEFKLSTAYFSNLFKQANGVNFHKYVTSVRIREAKRLLKETDTSIAEIAALVGYANLSHFIRVFREETDMTPGAHRKQSKA
ncbi:MAG: helix-turn-helix domain-containing protein [Clostridia bacterium]|nr:helix-turn-helix domain-containing protein [Clostridia bacterium]